MEHFIIVTLSATLSFFTGFVLGRIGHIFGGQIKAPHHWIYGFILVVASPFFRGHFSSFVMLFGLGLFISDLRDFLALKIYGVDDEGEKKFWRLD